MAAEFAAHSVVIHTIDSSSAIKLGGITSMGLPLNTEVTGDDSGSIFETFGAINFQAPQGQFSTKSIAAALGVIPQTGICIRSDVSHPGVKFYGEAKADCQSGEPDSNDHLSYLFDLGLMVPVQLSGSLRSDVILTVEIDAISDGTNAPVSGDYAATLPTSLDLSQFVIGGIRVANILWDDCRNFELAFNVSRAEREPQLGGIWPTRAAREKAQPMATFTARNPTKLDDSTGIPFMGKEATHPNTVIYFRKRLNRATFYPDGDLVHAKLTIAGLAYFDNPFSASGRKSAETTAMIKGIHDGTNAPLIFTSGIAYDPTP